MHKQRIAVLIAALIGIIATFLPWANVPLYGTVSGMEGGGMITLGLCALALILAFLGDRSQPVGSGLRIGIAVLGLLTAVYGVLQIMNVNDKLAAMGTTEATAEIANSVSLGIGLYLVIFAGFLLLVLPFALGGRNASAPVATSPA